VISPDFVYGFYLALALVLAGAAPWARYRRILNIVARRVGPLRRLRMRKAMGEARRQGRAASIGAMVWKAHRELWDMRREAAERDLIEREAEAERRRRLRGGLDFPGIP
jgi:hypothetical protein